MGNWETTLTMVRSAIRSIARRIPFSRRLYHAARPRIDRVRSWYQSATAGVRELGQTLRYDAERLYWGQRFPQKPTVLNFFVNDICNSRCTMCMIWKKKRDKELTPAEFEQLMQDPLFSDLEHIGMTGGEPTLRADLPDLFDAAVRMLPKLKSAGTITNAIRGDSVIERIDKSIAVCKERQVPFSVMISLDGVGQFHDLNRGKKGNFESAVRVLRHFRDRGDVFVTVGATITRHNVWGVGDLLDFCNDERVYARFRVAEFIGRLYNDSETDVIRAFSPDEAYHLALFFHKLETEYEHDPTVQRTYRSIRGMLVDALKRAIGCPYQTRSISLDCRGQLLYCSPKSKIVGDATAQSALEIYNSQIAERRRILKDDCSNCIHDYHSPLTTAELAAQYREGWWHRRLSLESAERLARWMTPKDGRVTV